MDEACEQKYMDNLLKTLREKQEPTASAEGRKYIQKPRSASIQPSSRRKRISTIPISSRRFSPQKFEIDTSREEPTRQPTPRLSPNMVIPYEPAVNRKIQELFPHLPVYFFGKSDFIKSPIDRFRCAVIKVIKFHLSKN
jgi:hypothetical protein